MLGLLFLIAATDIDPGAWKLLVQYFGVPGAMMAVVIFAMMKGWIITAREFNAMLALMGELKKEKDYWRDLALRATHIAEGAATTARSAAEKLTGGP